MTQQSEVHVSAILDGELVIIYYYILHIVFVVICYVRLSFAHIYFPNLKNSFRDKSRKEIKKKVKDGGQSYK